MAPSIVTITVNPAIDKSTTVDHLLSEQKLRCSPARYDAGGGGINVSKALKKLGAESLALFSSGGPMGLLLQDLIHEERIPFQVIGIHDWTRENFIITEASTNAQYRFGFPGPTLTPVEEEAWMSILQSLPLKPDYVVASGSLSLGLPDDFYARIAREVRKIGSRFILDTSGEPLKIASNEGVFLLKPNLGELSKLAGVERLEMSDVDDAAKEIIAKGNCQVVVVSLGPSGALLITHDLCEHIPAPMVKKQSTVGAGDSMVAGMTWALTQGKSYQEMIRIGVACGSAATMNPGTELFKKEDVEQLLYWLNQYGNRYRQ